VFRGLVSIGLGPGDNVVVHSSLKSFGPVKGGADTIIDALEEVVSREGTILMPTFTGQLLFFLESLALESLSPTGGPVFLGTLRELWIRLKSISEASGISYPFRSPQDLCGRIRGEKPFLQRRGWTLQTDGSGAGDCERIRILRRGPRLSRERVKPWLMPVWTGRIPETFWRRPETVRSRQYSGSFTAWGRYAHRVLSDHDNRLGQRLEDHPLYRMSQLNGRILLLGVDHRANSTIHVAQWTAFREYPVLLPDSMREFLDDFQSVEEPLQSRGGQKRRKIGGAEVRLVDTRALFDVVSDLLRDRVGAPADRS